MSKCSVLLAVSVAALVTAPSYALVIKLNDTGGTQVGTIAYHDFRIAADYWQSQLKNDVTVNLNVGFESFGPDRADVLGSTGSSYWVDTAAAVQAGIRANARTTLALKAAGNLPTLTGPIGALSVITPGYVEPLTNEGIDTRKRIFDNDGSANNYLIGTTVANAKALGLVGDDGSSDASVSFNSDFRFDFDPSNGIGEGRINFLQVAIHEIGHALGFVSGVDDYDYVGCPNGPLCASYSNYDTNQTWWGSTLDMYRYSSNPTAVTASDGTIHAAGPTLDWSIRNAATDGASYTNPYFSIDGGATALFGNLESRGQFNTNSYQASHWRSSVISGQPYLGIMDAVGRSDGDFAVTALDIAAFNAIGWDTTVDALANPNYAAYTGDIFLASDVPEPATWALFIGGFGIAGTALRRQRKSGFATA